MKNQTAVRMVALATVVASALTLVSIFGSTPAQAVSCAGAPNQPTFNPFPITYTDEPCKDYPAIDARLINGHYSQNQTDWQNGLQAQDGDEIYVALYVHNGALPTSDNAMQNVQVSTHVPQSVGQDFTISTTFTANNATAYSRNFTIHTNPGSHLDIVPNSGELFNYQNQPLASGFNVGNTTYTIGDMQACFEHSVIVRFRVKVVGPTTTPTPTPTPPQTTILASIDCKLGSATPAGFESRTLIKFRNGLDDPSNVWMSSKTGAGRRTQENANVSLQPGTYRVTLAEFDTHSDQNPPQYQQREQYYLELKDGNGTIVGRTGDSQDIPDNQDYWKSIADTALVIGSGVTRITPAHAAFPDNSSANSLTATCAAFDKVIAGNPALTITKQAKNITQNSAEAATITANPSDTVEFVLRVSNTGNANATNVMVSDSLPSRLTYIAGSTTVDGVSTNDGITSGTMSVGTLTPSQTKTIRFRAQVAGDSQFTIGPTTLTNTGYASADSVARISDSANVVVTRSNTDIKPDLSMSKRVRNLTQNSGETTTVSANPSDLLEFVIRVTNSGDGSSANTLVGDALPARLTYINGSTTVDGAGVNDGITSGAINIGSVAPAQTRIIRFRAQVAGDSQFQTGTTTLTNTATVAADNVPSMSGQASVTVTKQSPQTLVCNPAYQSGQTNQTFYFSAQGGTGAYTWSAIAGNPSTGNGASFNTLYGAAGTHYVVVSRGNQTDTCTVNVINATSASLTIAKTVINVSQNSAELDTVSANSGETVEFVLRVGNNGTGSATNVIVTDALPYGLTYITGSTTIDGNYQGDGITNNGISIGTVVGNLQNRVIRFRARIANGNTMTLTNYGYASADNASTVNDTARVTVNQNSQISCTPSYQSVAVNGTAYLSVNGGTGTYYWYASSGNPVHGSGSSFSTRYSSTGTYTVSVSDSSNGYATCTVNVSQVTSTNLSIDKTVRNITQNTSEGNTTNARSGDTLEFVLRVAINNNQYANNIRVWDILPTGLHYVAGSTTVDGSYRGDGITSGGIIIGSYNGYRTIIVRFQAQVDSSNLTYSSYLTNYGYASADNVGQVSDTAYVTIDTIGCVSNCNYQLSIQKLGKDISKADNTERASVTANPSDTVEFFLHVQNLSNTTLYNVFVRDVLPSGLSYINRTTSVDNIQVNDGIVSGGINIGTLAPNQTVIVRYDAVVNAKSYFTTGTTTLTNYAYVRADNSSEVSAQMHIYVNNGCIIKCISKVPTGTNGMALILGLASIMTVFYMAYTRTGLFKTRDAQSAMARMQGNSNKFNFVR